MGRRDKPGHRILRKREIARDLPNAPRLSSRERPQRQAGRVRTVCERVGRTDKAKFLGTMSWSDQYPDDFDMFVQGQHGYRQHEAGFMVLDATIAAALMIHAGHRCYRPSVPHAADGHELPKEVIGLSIACPAGCAVADCGLARPPPGRSRPPL